VSEYVLEIIEGPDAGRQIPLPEQSIELGREADVEIKLESDSLISRHHARLTPTAGGVLVEDLDSSNGTFVDENQIYSAAVLSPGDRLTVGVTVLELRTQEQAAAATVVRPIPAGLTSHGSPVAADGNVPVLSGDGLAAEERTPDYVPPELSRAAGDSPLNRLLDVHTKRKASIAPLAIFVLVAFVVMIALAVR
jgi:Inner membrane component of T3SS, cytoplasmic domain